jgi:peptidoglycan/xylan/chitin deacetylase (PgdA/CDA1 family)
MQPRVTVFFRFDDYSETSPVAVESGLVSALSKYSLNATFGVIPAVTEGSYHVPGIGETRRLGQEKARFLREWLAAGTIDVALHGWNHRTRSGGPSHSEFRGMALNGQRTRIQNGRDLLQTALGQKPSVFVPPWNAYDDQTLQALLEFGFTCISANRYGASRSSELRYLPTTADLRELRQSVAAARQSGDPSPIVGVLLHPYDFAGSGDPRADVTWSAFEADLHWLTQQPDVDVLPIGRIAELTPSLTAGRYRANQPPRFESAFPPFVPTTFSTPFFMSEPQARRTRTSRTAITASTYVAAVLVGWFLVLAYRQWIQPSINAPAAAAGIRTSLGISMTLLMARIAIRRRLYFRTALASAFLLGILVSSLL